MRESDLVVGLNEAANDDLVDIVGLVSVLVKTVHVAVQPFRFRASVKDDVPFPWTVVVNGLKATDILQLRPIDTMFAPCFRP